MISSACQLEEQPKEPAFQNVHFVFAFSVIHGN